MSFYITGDNSLWNEQTRRNQEIQIISLPDFFSHDRSPRKKKRWSLSRLSSRFDYFLFLRCSSESFCNFFLLFLTPEKLQEGSIRKMQYKIKIALLITLLIHSAKPLSSQYGSLFSHMSFCLFAHTYVRVSHFSKSSKTKQSERNVRYW